MANGDIQDNLSNDYLTQYNLNLGVSAVEKVSQFSYIQNLTYNGILNYLKDNFLGLADWQEQITNYSSASTVLTSSFTAIKTYMGLNRQTAKNIVEIEGLGKVGNEFSSIQGYSRVFSLSDSELQDPDAAENKVSNIL